jgi:protein involved in polysaccharide export with SLBB domain
MNFKKYGTLLLGILILMLANGFNTTSLYAQSSVQEELSKRNLTLSQARQLARQAGVNPDNPDELRRFAKANGVSDEQINTWLSEMGMDSDELTPSTQVQDLRNLGVGTTDIKEYVPDNSKIQQLPDTTPPVKGGLTYFGYNIFQNVADAFKPSAVGTVDDGYIVGPDDEMRLVIWGATELQYEISVDAEGRIFIPSIGQLTVAGQTIKELRSYLKIRLSKIYSGLTKTSPTVFMDVTLTRLRPIRVFVIGELENPGGYTFSSYSTLFNVLYGVGGPTVNGSLRDIRLIRDGKVITSFDLYEFLLRGIDSGSLRLQNNDRIFIPPRKSSITIDGPVVRPAIYELKEGEDLNDILKYAGGLKPEAYGKRFSVRRILPIDERQDPSIARIVLDYNLQEVLTDSQKFLPIDGDEIMILGISDRLENVAYISGSVYQEGEYEIGEEIKTVKDLIQAADGLLDDAYMYRGELVRTNPNLTKTFFSLDLERILSGEDASNMILQRLDRIQIYSNTVELISNRFVEISGSVANSGEYKFSENMTLGDLILISGGLTEDAYLGEIEISRLEKPEDETSKSVQIFLPLLEEDKDKFYKPELLTELLKKADQFKLNHRDQVYIRGNSRFEPQKFIVISGEVKYPGTYTLLNENEKLTNILQRAGGFTSEGYAKGGKLTRNGSQVIIDMSKVKKGNNSDNIELLPGDEIFIPRVPNTVEVTGNVGLEGLVKYQPGEKVSYYLERVGGMRENSKKRVLLTQPDGSTWEVKRKGLFKDNPEVFDGASIRVLMKPEEQTQERLSPREFLQETTALLTGVLTVILLIDSLNR